VYLLEGRLYVSFVNTVRLSSSYDLNKELTESEFILIDRPQKGSLSALNSGTWRKKAERD
jgi:hypothetical protein